MNVDGNENIKHMAFREVPYHCTPYFYIVYTFDGKKYRTKGIRVKIKTTIPADTLIEDLLKSHSSPHLQETHFPTILEALFKNNNKNPWPNMKFALTTEPQIMK